MEPRDVATAFLVLQHPSGDWEATPDINLAVRPAHQASVMEMKFGASEVASDIEASKVAAITAQQMMALTKIASEQAQHNDLRAKLKI